MKKLFLLLFLLPLAFVACSDDNKEQTLEEKIVSTWIYDSRIARPTTLNDKNDKLALAISKYYAIDAESLYRNGYTFKGDGRFEYFVGKSTYSGKYTIAGNTISLKYDDNALENNQYSFTFIGELLHMSTDITERAKTDKAKGLFDRFIAEGDDFGDASIKSVKETTSYKKE